MIYQQTQNKAKLYKRLLLGFTSQCARPLSAYGQRRSGGPPQTCHRDARDPNAAAWAGSPPRWQTWTLAALRVSINPHLSTHTCQHMGRKQAYRARTGFPGCKCTILQDKGKMLKAGARGRRVGPPQGPAESVQRPRGLFQDLETLGHLPCWASNWLRAHASLFSSNISLLKWECISYACSNNESQEEMVYFLV